MWNTELLDELAKIHDGASGSDEDRMLLRDYLAFHASDARGEHYDVGYAFVMACRDGRVRNPFVWIGYTPPQERSCYTVYHKEG